jgi:hypothetical protein
MDYAGIFAWGEIKTRICDSGAKGEASVHLSGDTGGLNGSTQHQLETSL